MVFFHLARDGRTRGAASLCTWRRGDSRLTGESRIRVTSRGAGESRGLGGSRGFGESRARMTSRAAGESRRLGESRNDAVALLRTLVSRSSSSARSITFIRDVSSKKCGNL